jgi:hypothetical protein
MAQRICAGPQNLSSPIRSLRRVFSKAHPE